MRRMTAALAVFALLAATPALALNSGDDILVPAAGRTDPWVTDLYVMNPGSSTVSVTVSWLIRGQTNQNPDTISFDLRAEETAILEDVILQEFGFASGASASGAFRVEATGPVIVNSRIYADRDTASFGQGFEGVPVWAATAAGQSTNAVGLTRNSRFRTNVYALAGADGAAIDFTLLDPSNSPIAEATLVLDTYEPYLRPVQQLFAGLGNFDDATLHAEVTSGSAVIGASKVDNDEATGDPTTLESAATSGSASSDGYYHFALYDSELFAAGGYILIEDGQVEDIVGTYVNYDKVEDGFPVCLLIFPWGFEFFVSFAPIPVEDFEDGVTFTEIYDDGEMTFTVQFTLDNNMSLDGTVTAEGSNFTFQDECGDDTGCNGTFPPLTLAGGKADGPPPAPAKALMSTDRTAVESVRRQPRRVR